MPRRFCILLATTLAAFLAASGRAADEGMAPVTGCEVIARVNSEVILACDLEWQVRLMFEQRFGPLTPEMLESPMYKEGRDQLLRQLIVSQIEVALLYSDFRSNAPQADLEAIHKQLGIGFEKEEVPKLQKTVGAEDRAQLEARLIELGTSLPERRDSFYRTMIARSWLTQSTNVEGEVSHQEMLDYYRAHEQAYHKPNRVRWEEMVVRFDRHTSKSEAHASLANRMNPLLDRIDATPAGEPAFAEIAAAHSDGFTAADGGQHEWTNEGAMASPEMNEALFGLPIGQRSVILESPVGFHVVRVLERRDAGPVPFSEVQAAIRKGLQNERFDAAVNKRVTKLKQSARLWTVFTGDTTHAKLAEELAKPTRR